MDAILHNEDVNGTGSSVFENKIMGLIVQIR